MRAWKDRLLDAIALRCVRQSRRDPRDSAVAEQSLYDQLDCMLDNCRRGQMADIVIRTENWCQNLLMKPDELGEVCLAQVRQIIDEMH